MRVPVPMDAWVAVGDRSIFRVISLGTCRRLAVGLTRIAVPLDSLAYSLLTPGPLRRYVPLFLRRGQFADADILVTRFRGFAAVNLDRNEARLGNVVFRFRVVHGFFAIEPELDAFALATDSVIVPVVLFEGLFNYFGGGLLEDPVAAGFVVETAPVMLTHVGLIANNLGVAGDAFGADLDAGVRVLAHELNLEFEFEMVEALGGAEEIVSIKGTGEAPGNDRALFDAELGAIPFPAGECFAVEEGLPVGEGLGESLEGGEAGEKREEKSDKGFHWGVSVVRVYGHATG